MTQVLHFSKDDKYSKFWVEDLQSSPGAYFLLGNFEGVGVGVGSLFETGLLNDYDIKITCTLLTRRPRYSHVP